MTGRYCPCCRRGFKSTFRVGLVVLVFCWGDPRGFVDVDGCSDLI